MSDSADDIGGLLDNVRNELAVAIAHCDRLAMEVSGQGMQTVISIREACAAAVTFLNAWHQSHSAPFTYTIEPGFVWIVVPTNPKPEGFVATLDRVLVDARFRRGMAILCDQRGAPPPTVEYLRTTLALAHQYVEDHGHCRWAFVARNDDAETFALVRRTAASTATSARLWSFTDVDCAIRWLRRPM